MTAASFLFWIGTAAAVFHIGVALQFAWVLRRRATIPPVDFAWPKVAILLPLRGADPHLAEGLRRLLRQDYPRYELHTIIDSVSDPAHAVVAAVMAETGATHVRISTIRNKRSTCSPQCSALVQGVESLDADVEIVSIIDGDVLTHPSWLRELVTPLLQPDIGATHGNRWFLPSESGWGSMVRYIWIAASVVPMYWFGFPWAGTFAIRRRALEDSNLLADWSRSIVPDAPAMPVLKSLNLKIRFVPSLMMINRERCGLAFAHDFMKRQMMWTRLYHPQFWPVVVHAFLTTLIWAAAGGMIAYNLFAGDFGLAGWAAGTAVVYLGALLGALAIIEFAVREVGRRRGQTGLCAPPGFLVKMPYAVLLTQFVHAGAVLLATLRNRVTWRGVTYVVRAPFDVVIEGDRAMTVEEHPAEANVSL